VGYPRIEIYLDKIKENTEKIVKECTDRGIDVVGVTKVFCGHEKIAEVMIEGGVSMLADARIENLRRLSKFSQPKMLLRLPMLSQINRVIKYSDISLVSDIMTIKKLSLHAKKQNKIHKIILMIDLGDLREGIYDDEEICESVKEILKLEGVVLHGIGVNLTCFGGVMPTRENLSRLVAIKNRIEEDFDVKLMVISGGASGTMSLFKDNQIPDAINQLRLGSSLTLGIGLNDEPIDGLHHDAVKLVAEVVEIKNKPSVPIGEIGLDAFGLKPVFQDKGIRKRAICALGKQDVSPNHLTPYDTAIEVLGASSDHLLLDITDTSEEYKVGDKISFHLAYGGCLSAMTSKYVYKSFKRKNSAI